MTQYKAGLTAEDVYNRFSDRFKKIVEETMSEVITEYLPHAESDLDSNVYHRSMDYIAGEFGESTIYGSMGKRFRQRIFEENKELIIKQLDKDNLEKIAELEEQVNEWKKAFYERR
jgi:hypothetical protein